jgi:hypothetical protein
VDDQQGAAVGLQFNAQADEVAFDLRIDVAKLVGGEVGRVFIQSAGGGGDEFQQGGRLAEPGAAFDQPGRLSCKVGQVVGAANEPAVDQVIQVATNGRQLIRIEVQVVGRAERRVEQGHVDGHGAAGCQFFPGRGRYVVRVDLAG